MPYIAEGDGPVLAECKRVLVRPHTKEVFPQEDRGAEDQRGGRLVAHTDGARVDVPVEDVPAGALAEGGSRGDASRRLV